MGGRHGRGSVHGLRYHRHRERGDRRQRHRAAHARDCRLADSEAEGVYLAENAGTRDNLDDAADAGTDGALGLVLHGCRIERTAKDAVYMTGRAVASLVDCRISDVRATGVVADGSAQVRLEGVTVADATGTGLAVNGTGTGPMSGAVSSSGSARTASSPPGRHRSR